jgi:AbrB family looped-hinge helix DNA binding protein
VRLLLDEMYAAAVAEQLRARGHDVVSVHDPDYRQLEGARDEVFAAAVAERRALVTENVPDYRRLEADALAQGKPIPTLVFTTNKRFPSGDPGTIGRLVRALDALLGQELPPTASFLKPPRLAPAPRKGDERYSLQMRREVKTRRRGTTRISRKNQVTIPAEAARKAGLRPGDVLEVVAVEPGQVAFRRADNPYRRFAGALTGLYPPGYLEALREEWR